MIGSEIEEISSPSPSRRRDDGGGDDLLEITAREEEITEVLDSKSSVFSYDFDGGDDGGGGVVYVAVVGSEEEGSMDALLWALRHAHVDPTSSAPLVFLVHVFPETKFIPSPLGIMPISRVNPVQKENHMAQERSKRRQFLQKFLDVCTQFKVQVDTILIESDTEAKAILDLISICNIRKLVLGTSKSNLRKMKSKKSSSTVEQILQSAPEFCEIKIIWGGKEVQMDQQMSDSPSPSPRAKNDSPRSNHGQSQNQNQNQNQNDSFGCICFKPKVLK